MMTIKVNGRVEKLHVGCRTSVFLDVILRVLEVGAPTVSLNGEPVQSHEFGTVTVKAGDVLKFATA
jgi:sulfur carrier protein ThiS